MAKAKKQGKPKGNKGNIIKNTKIIVKNKEVIDSLMSNEKTR